MKIAVVGSQCVGKSTFIADVIKACPELSSPTWTYRDAIKEAGIEKKINQKTCIASQKIIFDAICEETKRSPNNTIHDRSVMDAVVYTTWPVTKAKKTYTDITQSAVDAMKRTADGMMWHYDLIVYIPVDESIALTNDEFRDTDPVYRKEVADIFENLLILDFDDPNFDKYGYKVVSISGTREERVADFKEFIKTLT